MSQFYRHSGTVPVVGVIVALLFGLVTATVAAFVYAYAVEYIPFVYLNLLMTLGFGWAIGQVVLRQAKSMSIRNALVPTLIGLVCGLWGVYAAWAADFAARQGRAMGLDFTAGLNPMILIDYIGWFYENGQWGVAKGAVVSGWPLAIVWLIEAGMIVFIAASVVWSDYDESVYCEPCGRWAKVEPAVALLDASSLSTTGTDGFVRRIQEKDLTGLRELASVPADSMNFLKLSLSCCESCSETNTLKVEHVQATLNKKQERSEKSDTLVNRLLLTVEEVELVREVNQPAGSESMPEETAADPSSESESDPAKHRPLEGV